MVVAIGRQGSNTDELWRNSKYLLLDKDTDKVVLVKAVELYNAIGRGTIEIENLYIENVRIHEVDGIKQLRYNKAEWQRVKGTIIYKNYNEVVIASRHSIKYTELTKDTADGLEGLEMKYVSGMFIRNAFKARDIEFEDIEVTDEDIKGTDKTVKCTDETVIGMDGTVKSTDETALDTGETVADMGETVVSADENVTGMNKIVVDMNETVASVDETVEDADETVEDAVETVEDAVEDTVEDVKDAEVKERPKPLISMSTGSNNNVNIDDMEDIGDPNCKICHGKGRYTSGLFGLVLTCECVAHKKEREAEEARRGKPTEPVYNVTGAQKIQVVAEDLVPYARRDDEFDIGITKERIKGLYGSKNGSVSAKDFKNYASILNTIISSISIGVRLDTSYIIGAPNGFGKTTFANTCIKRLYARGKKAVPYKSLLEIAELRNNHVNNLNKQFKKAEYKKENDDTTYENKTYTWKEYCNAEIVFCYLTTPENGWTEWSTLKALITIRATNGLATIVMTDSSLQLYKNNTEIRRYILDDILAPDKQYGGLDRLVHHSVYVIYRTGLGVAVGRDF